MSDTKDFAAWLEADDEQSRPHRAERLRFLVDEYGATGNPDILRWSRERVGI